MPGYGYFCDPPATPNEMPVGGASGTCTNPNATIDLLPTGSYVSGGTQFSLDLGFPFRYAFVPQFAIVALQTLMAIDFNSVAVDHINVIQTMDDAGNMINVSVPTGNSAKPDLEPSIGLAAQSDPSTVDRRDGAASHHPISTPRLETFRCRSHCASKLRPARSSISASRSRCSTSTRLTRRVRSTTASSARTSGEVLGVKVCPRCFTRFPDGERFCLHDSAVLVEEEDIARLGHNIGNYRLDKILGRGGMGTVYAGEHVYIKKPVAVKVLHPQFAKYQEAIHRFLREARAATSINHPNIVDVTDFGILPDGPVYFVMEFLEGKSLEDLIEKEGAVELHRALNIANQIALALDAAHAIGVIHRDLKPDNIMLLKKPGRRDLVRMQPDQTLDHRARGIVRLRQAARLRHREGARSKTS